MSKMLLLDVHSERERDSALMPNSTSISIRSSHRFKPTKKKVELKS